jgi:hypothetical protein
MTSTPGLREVAAPEDGRSPFGHEAKKRSRSPALTLLRVWNILLSEMKTASIRELQTTFAKLEAWLQKGEEVLGSPS